MKWLFLGVMMAASLSFHVGSTKASVATHQDFDNAGTAYVIGGDASSSSTTPPEILAGGPTGSFLRLVHGTGGTYNIGFNMTATGAYRRIVAEFDFRMIPGTIPRADGFGFALLNTAHYGTAGAQPEGSAEEPNFVQSFGVGFDIFDNHGSHPYEPNNNHVSLHFEDWLASFPITPFDLAGGQFIRSEVVLEETSGGANASVSLTPFGGSTIDVVSDYFIEGLTAYENRVRFGARTGAASADHDLDNINVQYLEPVTPAIPEPASLAVWSLLCLVGLGVVRHRKRRKRH